LGGNFNGRIGEKGTRNWEEERGEGKRKFKDKVDNAEGKRLMEWIEENGWEVLNGNKQGHEEAEWTYKYLGSRGETVIDYGIANEEAWERVEKFRIEERVEWDHLEIALRKRKGGTEQRRKEVENRNKTVYLIFFFWNCCFMFRKKCNQESESPQGKIKNSFIRCHSKICHKFRDMKAS
jgi:hypothetical protein